MKKVLFLFFTMLGLFGLTTAALAAPQAICVRWQAGEVRAHKTYSGAEITLKGIARGGATEFRWDYGDGGGTNWAPIADPYNLGVKHAYAGVVGTEFAATLHVRDAAQEATDTYPIKIYLSTDLSVPEELDVRRDMSIDEGLWYLHTRMIRQTYAGGSPGYGQTYGYWAETYYNYPLAAVGTAVDAFQVNGHKLIGDDAGDPYVETVKRATNYLLVNTYSYAIAAQPAGNPDTNGNGIGLVANYSSNLYDGRQTYIGGICMTALASSGSPNYVAPVGGNNVYGRTVKDIVQDMIDFFAWGQVDSGSGRGGWRYYANYSDADMSTTQWPPLGMKIARDEMGCTVPAFVGTELVLFLNATQSNDQDNDNGAFGYSVEDQYNNITKTAAGLICHDFLGTPWTDPRMQRALGFIYRHWNDTGASWDYTKLHGNSYGMYGVMKAFRLPNPDVMQVMEYNYVQGQQTGASFNWYYTPAGQSQEGLASYIVRMQQSDGSWDDNVGSNPVYDAFCTGWRILTLAWVTIPPKAVICRTDQLDYNWNQDINVDGSCSYHPDPERLIVKYEWDWDYNGTFVPDAEGIQATKAGGYPATGLYPVVLRVTDDRGQFDMAIVNINVHEPPHCPKPWAFPVQGGHYIGWINVPITLDASGTTDPNNDPLIYEWELNWDVPANDPKFDDATGINPAWTWATDGVFRIGLRVTDVPTNPSFQPCTKTDFTTVEIGNHAPVADPNGPYSKAKSDPNLCLTLDGSTSSDPDFGDTITFAWDTDADGIYDDCNQPTCEFCILQGAEIGDVYDIRLKVTDSLGKYDIKSTTVTVVANRPPIAQCKDVTVPAGLNCMANVSIDDGSFDPDGDPITIVQTPAGPYSLSSSPLSVTLTVTDDKGASASCTATVTVIDTTPPAITCPGNVTVDTDPGQCSASNVALDEPTSGDNCGVAGMTNNAPAVFPKGETIVTWTVTDASGNTAACTQNVTVEDHEMPVISNGAATPNTLWPPNHELVSITVNYAASDNCGATACTLSATSNEPDNGLGDGDTANDIQLIPGDAHHLNLRAERSGTGDGRIYTITSTCTDGSGNTTKQAAQVRVPHNR